MTPLNRKRIEEIRATAKGSPWAVNHLCIEQQDFEALSTLALEAERYREALEELHKASKLVSKYGARTGSQWSKLSCALIKARFALQPKDSQ